MQMKYQNLSQIIHTIIMVQQKGKLCVISYHG